MFPVSTRAQLITNITRTDIFRDISGMTRTETVPFILLHHIFA